MKYKIILLVMGLIILIGCGEKAIDTRCPYGYHFDGEKQRCLPDALYGCYELQSFDSIEFEELPVGYTNIIDNYDDGYLRIDIFCGNGLLKPDNQSCAIFVKQMNEEFGEAFYEGVGVYRFRGGYNLDRENKTKELCFE